MTAEMYEQPLGKEEQARQWLAEFSGLLNVDDGASEEVLRRAVATAERLAVSGPELRSSMPYLTVDSAIVDTLDKAVQQIPSVAEELRRRLARHTGQPLATDLDLDALRERLSEREARLELGVPTEEEVPVRLDLPPTDPNYVAAGFTLLFGLGWTSFTTFHAVMMIGGLSQMIGFGALFLLLFYSIFFAVGFGMLYTAYTSMRKEAVSFEGRQMTVTHTIFGRTTTRVYDLGPDAIAEFAVPVMFTQNQSNGNRTNAQCISITDATGKKRRFMASIDADQLSKQIGRINSYLRAQKPSLNA